MREREEGRERKEDRGEGGSEGKKERGVGRSIQEREKREKRKLDLCKGEMGCEEKSL